ncbi:flagellar biosynthesis anti-sigma factor FlgM [Thermovibrio ammonificans]|uniref:Anti-sigma-28 factor FlgM family protein n=1 Tax=Thermovibrio ammonificans (strain DSM 15698 / JCM 12110 / HB-1) TaxID=648996 RepID=E8T5K1_THEA1|nr:flagellar biosynthesis anti-sigma factor FlgM [Thermovibrio ammonificans]ADU96476.1 Anti-sigma-28 factor FlgM family protein [Thermovibrio ammonificans HB-1]
MRIESLSSELMKLLAGKSSSVRSGKVKRAGASESSEVEVSVEITAEISGLKPEPVSKEKVEAIKRAIAEGRYPIKPEAISEAIVKELLGL